MTQPTVGAEVERGPNWLAALEPLDDIVIAEELIRDELVVSFRARSRYGGSL
jgi:hypothetical protein